MFVKINQLEIKRHIHINNIYEKQSIKKYTNKQYREKGLRDMCVLLQESKTN